MSTYKNKAVFRPLVAVIALGALLAGCVQREATGEVSAPDRVPNSELSNVVLKVGDQKGGTEALLRSSGQLDGAPYKVEFSTFTSGPPQVEALSAGRIDVAVTGNTPPVFGVASKARIRIVSAYGNEGKGDQILVPTGSPITNVTGLKGKKVAVGKGTSAHGNLLLQLKKAGLSISDIEPVFLQPADAQAAFARGDVDAWAIWDPYTAITSTESQVRTLADASGVSNGYWFGLAAIDALEDPARSTAIADLVVRIGKAGQWSRDNNAEWATDYAKAIGISEQAARISQARSTRVPRDLLGTVESEQKLADAFVDAGEITGPVSFADYVDNRYAPDIAAILPAQPAAAPSTTPSK